MRVAVGVTAGVLLAPLLAACGGGTGYCDTVTAHQEQIGSVMHSDTGTGALQLLGAFEALEVRSPDDVRDDWQLLVTRIRALRTALEDAHVDPASYDAKHPPPGLTHDERTRIRNAAAELAAADARQALSSVQQEVLDVCHTPLGL
jgi:hypothetical protein